MIGGLCCGEYGNLCTEHLDELVKGKGDSGWGVTLYEPVRRGRAGGGVGGRKGGLAVVQGAVLEFRAQYILSHLHLGLLSGQLGVWAQGVPVRVVLVGGEGK